MKSVLKIVSVMLCFFKPKGSTKPQGLFLHFWNKIPELAVQKKVEKKVFKNLIHWDVSFKDTGSGVIRAEFFLNSIYTFCLIWNKTIFIMISIIQTKLIKMSIIFELETWSFAYKGHIVKMMRLIQNMWWRTPKSKHRMARLLQ